MTNSSSLQTGVNTFAAGSLSSKTWPGRSTILQLKPERWQCLATSFAMAVNCPVKSFMEIIGHVGGTIVDPVASEPANRIGPHVQECLYVARSYWGRYFTPFDFLPTLKFPCGDIAPDCGCVEHILLYLNSFRGVITGTGSRCGHAVAFERGIFFDPDGYILPFDDHREVTGFRPQTLWVISP